MSDVIQKVQRHHDLIKVTCREIGNAVTIQLILGVTDKLYLLGQVLAWNAHDLSSFT